MLAYSVIKHLVPVGWYLFNNSYQSPRWNLTGALQSVHVDFWTMAFFNFHIYPDVFNPKNYIIAVSCSCNYKLLLFLCMADRR